MMLTIFTLVMVLALAVPAWCQHGGPRPIDKNKPPSPGAKIIQNMQFKPLQWQVPQVGKDVTRTMLDNGMVVYIRSDKSLPTVDALLLIRTGSAFETAAEVGLASLTALEMRNGGTRTMSPDKLNEALEFIGASIESGASSEEASVGLDCLSRDMDLGLQLMASIVREPAFDEKKLQISLARLHEQFRRRNDEPETVAFRELATLVYGEHPYGRQGDWDVVKKFKPATLAAWHKRWYHPNNAYLAISGDFTTEQGLALVRKHFGSWKKAPDFKLPVPPSVTDKAKPGVFLVEKDISQSYVAVAHLGIKRDNPDRFAIQVMNHILGGGGFTSHLTERVRNQEGLAYSVYSFFQTSVRDIGLFGVESGTKAPSTVRTIQLILEEIKRMRAAPPPESELAEAKESFINRFIFSFSNSFTVVNRLMRLEFDGYPLDYYQTYLDNIRKVTGADVHRVAQKYLKPDQLTIMVVGNPKVFQAPLESVGKVIKIVPRTVE